MDDTNNAAQPSNSGLEIHTHRFFIKAVLNGVTVARICPLADGTWQTSGADVRSEVMTETAARSWLSAKTTAAALSIIL